MKPLWIVVALTISVSAVTLTPQAEAAPSAAPKAWLRQEAHAKSQPAPSVAGVLGKSLFVVAIIGAAGVFWVRRSRKQGIPSLPQRNNHVRVLSGTVIGPKARIVVAEVRGRTILLGVTEQSVRKLAWIDDDHSTDEARGPTSEAAATDEPHDTTRRGRPSTLGPKDTVSRSARFSDVLRDAVGIKAKRSTEPALVLAQATRDQVTLSRQHHSTEDDYVDIEGQAAGLVSRLQRK